MTMRIVIAIPTFRRPQKLAELIGSLPPRIAEASAFGDVGVLVVDNDPDGSAEGIVESSAGVPVRYVHEPRPGIAAARNRALDEASDARLLAFIDDDERPRADWLSALLRVWSEHRSAAVMGRVISIFEEDVDDWVVATGAFQRRPRPTGLSIPVAAAGNLLLDLDQVHRLGVRFDETLGLAGGEDTLFSKQLVARGGVIVWCNESETEDEVPRERLTRSWALKRGFNGGNSKVQVELRMTSSPATRAVIRVRALIGGLLRLGAGWLSHIRGRLSGDIRRDARGMRTVFRGLGMVSAAVGHTHQEYRRDA